MRTLIKMVVCLIIGVTAVSCSVSSSAIVTDYDREVPFGNYKTFYWSDDFQMDSNKENEPLFFNTLIKKRLKAAIQEQMENKGYVLDKNNPDLLVDSRVVVQTRNMNYNSGGYPYFPSYGHGFGHFGAYGYGYYGGYQSTEEHKEGGVVIELIDMNRRQLVWQGFAPDVLHADTTDKQKEIREAVAKIFAKYQFGKTVKN
ncbi:MULTISPECIES: DUF4136 domain-containing protein [Flavobacteriaceae]|uniref:Uncharacterized protein n=1 Tax=Maribacter cobaltidurans TaxID=1178778 RepID=A0A223V6H2_9FLAO|nr:DUF4136 domain-containing protein [Maribacter cobaltidurans]ASV30906.1 hypothetical protein CJ263_12155 [Maribacter cobaltidurans]GGD89610.1 lipoprotein [Maribacter cobaltidurans]GMN08155.1 DUF4136 domain-containing protein [Croceitalea sp. MTPC5]